MDQYMAFVYTIAYGKLSSVCDKQDIEECVSDIFYEIYRTRNNIDLEKGSLKSYIAVLSKHKAIDVFRKHQKSIAHLCTNERDYDLVASDTDVEKDVIDNEASEHLIREIKALGEPDSQIMIRKYYFGQNTKTISKALGIKENTVDKKVSRALVKLEQALKGAL
ncbi:MAG: sigma-70 family RNA polymerase sigma factor [Dehalococcoidia bacterium]|nr:sigma-70 family RNA polymerase sigma factor [Dehalococcoidia bacterium]